MNAPLIILSGPTGSGKSRAAVELALALGGGEIVNCDSVQVVRGFDIGSSKPTLRERASVPHHLFDIIDAAVEFNAAEFVRLAADVIAEIRARGGVPILTGGTGFYIRALLGGLPPMPGRNELFRQRLQRIARSPRGAGRLHRWLYAVDPVSAARIAVGDRHRVERALEVYLQSGRPISSWQRPSPGLPGGAIHLALLVERAHLLKILDARVEAMYAAGLVAETANLLRQVPSTARPFDSIGYREAAAVVQGRVSLEEALNETRRRTRAYAKRQMTWLRSEQGVQWVEAFPREDLVSRLEEVVIAESKKVEPS